MASIYNYNMRPTLDEFTNNNSHSQFAIHLNLEHVLELSYPLNTLIPYNTINQSYSLPRNRILEPQLRERFFETILSSAGASRDIVETLTHEASSFAMEIISNSSGGVAMVLDMSVLTPYNDQEEIDRAFLEVQAMQESTIILNPASKSCIEGLKRVVLDESLVGLSKAEECIICLDEFLVGDEITSLPCGHVFHGDCAVKWLRTSHSCPLCRFSML